MGAAPWPMVCSWYCLLVRFFAQIENFRLLLLLWVSTFQVTRPLSSPYAGME